MKAGEAQHQQHGTHLEEEHEKGGIIVPPPPPLPFLGPVLRSVLVSFFIFVVVAMGTIVLAFVVFGVGRSTGSDFRSEALLILIILRCR